VWLLKKKPSIKKPKAPKKIAKPKKVAVSKKQAPVKKPIPVKKEEKMLLPSSYPEPFRKKVKLIPNRILTARGYIQLMEDDLN